MEKGLHLCSFSVKLIRLVIEVGLNYILTDRKLIREIGNSKMGNWQKHLGLTRAFFRFLVILSKMAKDYIFYTLYIN